MRTRVLTGLESWFTLPAPPGAPRRPLQDGHPHLGDDLPLITAVIAVSAPLLGPPPLVPRLAVTTLVTVSLMTWAGMPRVPT
jgi:antibiotic biosynthesis monooxygenase (ABM) superfamily enzyme